MKLLASMQEATMRGSSNDHWAEILQRVNQEQERIRKIQEDRRNSKNAG